jgi:alpha-galactosidase
LADIQAIDTRWQRPASGEFTLHHNTGSPCTPNDYQPHVTPLAPKSSTHIATSGGRATDANLPYFNIEWPGAGAIVVLGWPGQWAAEFQRDETAGLRVRGGQELTHFKLLPGEEVRSPLVVVEFWAGDRLRAQNVWRRWMLAHNSPRPGGKPMPPISIMCTSDFYPGMKSNAADEIKYAEAYTNAGVKFDYWWIDAGWYPCRDAWPNVGTWQPDPQRYPKGIKEVADYVHSQGMKLVVWFEPERVMADTWLAKNHPEWLFSGKKVGSDLNLLNLGNRNARRWITDHVDRMLTGQGIDLYRQDFNMDPLKFWRSNDSPDRQGLAENLHVQGYLAYWDELLRRHPGMLIDSCASGGRRNDLETLRRAAPLLRSDYRAEAADMQSQTYGLAAWVPYFGTGVPGGDNDEYMTRSQWCPCFAIGRNEPCRAGLDWTKYHRLVAQWRAMSGCLSGDFYPLLPYSRSQAAWMAWQFDRPDLGEGMVQAFRRVESGEATKTLRLFGLDPTAQYELTTLDVGTPMRTDGESLLERGLMIAIGAKRGSAVIKYHRL